MNRATISTDLLIIGGGGSGLAAAVRARERGVKDVTVLEKTSRTGGNAWLAVVMLGLGNPMRLEPDMTQWRDETFAGLMQSGRWTLDARLIHAFVDTYPEVVRWLMSKGLTFDVNGFDVGGRKFSTLGLRERRGNYKVSDPARGPGFLGNIVTDLLAHECRRLNVSIHTKTRATNILLDDSGAAVRGVLASGPEGDLMIEAPRVILAAGGFGANEAMMRKHFPEHFREEGPINTLCSGASTGDGLVMAEEIGLVMGEDMDAGVIGPGHHPWHHSLHEAVHRPEMLWVNKHGERFVNESLSVMAGWALIRQPDSSLYALFDSATRDYISANPNVRQIAMGGEEWLRTLRQDLETEAGWTRKTAIIADSWDELAATIGVDPAVLRATVERYNTLCDQGRDADFVKAPDLLRPLRTPPFYAVLGVRFCHGTEGGVNIDERTEVKGRDGQRVAGLYATGDNTSGWVVEWGLPGTTLAFAFTSGYIAAENAASFPE
jgi:fumarate reductase flavoprotein subunit